MGFNWRKFLGIAEQVAPIAVGILAPQIPAIHKGVDMVDKILDRVEGDVHRAMSIQLPTNIESAFGAAFAALDASMLKLDPAIQDTIIRIAKAGVAAALELENQPKQQE